MATSTIITIAAGIAIALAAIVGVIIAVVTKGGWKDNGFLKPGWEHAADAVLNVMFAPGLGRGWQLAVQNAIDELNDICGRPVLCVTNPIPGYDWTMMPVGNIVTIVPGSAGDNPCTEHRFADIPQASAPAVGARVTLPQPFIEDRRAVCRHELGHVLRLAHDESPTSIMYYKVTVRGEYSDADKKRLRDKYGVAVK